jgi:hypothetical protein
MTSIIRFLNIIMVALLAGTSFGIWIGFNPKKLSVSTYIEQQQNLVRSLNALMIALVVIATLITIVSAFLQRRNKGVFIILFIAAAFLIACILITRFGNYPIQNDMLTWELDSVPEDWAILRDKWWGFHIMRTLTELIALSLITVSSIKK